MICITCITQVNECMAIVHILCQTLTPVPFCGVGEIKGSSRNQRNLVVDSKWGRTMAETCGKDGSVVFKWNAHEGK